MPWTYICHGHAAPATEHIRLSRKRLQVARGASNAGRKDMYTKMIGLGLHIHDSCQCQSDHAYHVRSNRSSRNTDCHPCTYPQRASPSMGCAAQHSQVQPLRAVQWGNRKLFRLGWQACMVYGKGPLFKVLEYVRKHVE